MITKKDYQTGLARILKNMRLKRGWSKAKIASEVYIDDKTWSRYEDGETSPTSPELLWIFSQLGENALPSILELIYPSVYSGLTKESNIDGLRKATAHYFMNVASEQTVRELDYILIGRNGSNIVPQMQMFTMYEHLPMQYRVPIARLIDTMWKLAESRGELTGLDHIMPDVKAFEDGLHQAEAAAYSKNESYTTIY